ncbi:nitrate reductase molybdenum cofactor assembly chaperone [Staphylococcus edaphicus]|uniref:Nitrate reductase molybdenum cofactor assembly chaperone n=1 Tax=Staphylococcus edaphicus TaxID=1955013 RepID=A0A2C6WQ68_9STAP|nr:nitrate reductase molybdenum cofactor assembly chaperone [Staphylococcus edaphicus]PHK49607.1 nitrate reductase molybdenum cofactor assembly chaperone [Staphylococcus edaphicus]UQW82040.1 nitrate reductase molybdenum cofactor assembly chaperone [Staphylococcus edaphicus]
MINLAKFNKYQETFGYLAQQLAFPEKLTLHPKIFEDVINSQHPAYEDLIKYREQMYELSLLQIKQLYSETFDFNKTAPLYMTYNKFDTQKERGQLLAKLKVLYEMFGLKMVDNELSDFLPLMLEFLYIAQWENDPRANANIEFVIMIIEDGTYAMAKQFAEEHSPYYFLVKSLRETLKACINLTNEVTQHV